MALTTTRNLGLLVDSNLTANAKTNLAKIDTLGASFYQDTTGNTVVRGITGIVFSPNSPDIGGSGSGGSVTFGSLNQTLDSVTFYVGSTNFGTLGLLDQATLGTGRLTFAYNSTLAGALDPTNRVLSIDVEGANRSLVLGADLSITSSSLVLGAATYTLPGVTSTLVDLVGIQTLSNKSLSGATNTFSAIPYSALVLTNSLTNTDVSSSAAIAYSKLNLASSIVNADVAVGAAIAYSKLNLSLSLVDADVAVGAAIAGTKLSPDFGSQNVRTTGQVQIARNGSIASTFVASASQASDINYTLPSAAPSNGQILVSDGSANLSWVSAGSGTVTSVAASLSAELDAVLDLSGSPVTTSGTLAFDLATQATGTVLAGPTSGTAKPTFRSLVLGDLPSISTTDVSEGTNLYYTSSRFDTAFGAKTTSNLTEGTNLYYTDTRADARISVQKGATNGLATLDGGGKIPSSQLPSTVMEYKGTWNATTNSPTLIDGTGDAGDVYLVSASGSQNLGSGSITFAVGDWVVYSGSVWQKSLNSNAVVSVNGATGVVVLSTSDISEGTNLYYTDGRVDTRLATYKYTTNWTNADGATKPVNHGLGTNDISWNIYDTVTGEEVWPDTATRTSVSDITFTTIFAPTNTLRIVIRK